jgi:hypothetical protein
VGCIRYNLSPVGKRLPASLSADVCQSFLPERSDRCDQPSCAFGGFRDENALLTAAILLQLLAGHSSTGRVHGFNLAASRR